MVDVLSNDKIGSWMDHDPRLRTTHYLLDGQPYSGATHPMRSARGLVHFTGVHHTAESRRLTFSLRAVVIPEDFAFLDREERVPREALDGMFERQPMEQDIYNITGERVAVRTVMRERQSPFNGERDKPRKESNIVTTRLFNTRQQRVIDRMAGTSSASVETQTDGSAAPPEDPSATPQSATTSVTALAELVPSTPPPSRPTAMPSEGVTGTPQPTQMSPVDFMRVAALIARPTPVRMIEFNPQGAGASGSASASGRGKARATQREITDYTFKQTKLATPPISFSKPTE